MPINLITISQKYHNPTPEFCPFCRNYLPLLPRKFIVGPHWFFRCDVIGQIIGEGVAWSTWTRKFS